MVGEGVERSRLTKLISELGIDSEVIFEGFRQNIPGVIKTLDLYVHPAVHEPFGIAILEAMAAGKCVVATAVEGVPEIVVDGVTGYLAYAGDQEKIEDVMAQLITNAIENEAERVRLGENGRKRVEDAFSVMGTVRGYQKVYESCFPPGRSWCGREKS